MKEILAELEKLSKSIGAVKEPNVNWARAYKKLQMHDKSLDKASPGNLPILFEKANKFLRKILKDLKGYYDYQIQNAIKEDSPIYTEEIPSWKKKLTRVKDAETVFNKGGVGETKRAIFLVSRIFKDSSLDT